VFAHTLQHFPKKKSIWLKAANLEKQHGTPGALDTILREAVAHCPEVCLWLRAARAGVACSCVPVSRRVMKRHRLSAAWPTVVVNRLRFCGSWRRRSSGTRVTLRKVEAF
jgi:hypothetical protein